jgi:hypothetical protein
MTVVAAVAPVVALTILLTLLRWRARRIDRRPGLLDLRRRP